VPTLSDPPGPAGDAQPSAPRPGGGAARTMLWSAICAFLVAGALYGPLKMATRDSGGGTARGERVSMAGVRFSPGTLLVERGTEVVFVNDDNLPHTVSAENGSVESGTLKPGDTFRLLVDGRLDYFCAIHPSMTASVDILA